MGKALVANNAVATLASGILDTDLALTLSAGQGALFPTITGGDYFYATLSDTLNNLEIIKCTARVGDVLTVVRAQDGTSARAYGAGDILELRPTAALFNEKAPLDSPAFTGTVTIATPLAVAQGGTGAITAAAARTNLSAQAQSALLDSVSAIAANGMIARTGAGAVAVRSLAAGSAKVSVTNADGVAGNPTVDVSEANFTLDNIGGTLGVAKGGTGATTAAAARTNLGLVIGTDVPSVAGAGASGTWGISVTGSANSAGNVTGTVAVANGGTGAITAAAAQTNLDVPSRIGSGASGTWGINVTGNSGTVTNGVYNNGGTYGINITGNAATASNGGVTSVNGLTGAVTVSPGMSVDTNTATTANDYAIGTYVAVYNDGSVGAPNRNATAIVYNNGPNNMFGFTNTGDGILGGTWRSRGIAGLSGSAYMALMQRVA